MRTRLFIPRSGEKWKKVLIPMQYHVLREKGTEPAFTGRYWDEHRKGMYFCAACGAKLFSSDAKFDSRTGWPSFFSPYSKRSVDTEKDYSLLFPRVEVHCKSCGGHLGHVFADGPKPTGLRYCINSASLKFKEEKKKNF